MDKKLESLKKNNGTSLVEVVVSIALLSIVLVLLTSCFVMGISLIGKTAKLTKNSEDTKGKLEQQVQSSAADQEIDTLTITAPDGTIYTIKGEYIEVTGSDGLTYKTFVPMK